MGGEGEKSVYRSEKEGERGGGKGRGRESAVRGERRRMAERGRKGRERREEEEMRVRAYLQEKSDYIYLYKKVSDGAS